MSRATSISLAILVFISLCAFPTLGYSQIVVDFTWDEFATQSSDDPLEVTSGADFNGITGAALFSDRIEIYSGNADGTGMSYEGTIPLATGTWSLSKRITVWGGNRTFTATQQLPTGGNQVVTYQSTGGGPWTAMTPVTPPGNYYESDTSCDGATNECFTTAYNTDTMNGEIWSHAVNGSGSTMVGTVGPALGGIWGGTRINCEFDPNADTVAITWENFATNDVWFNRFNANNVAGGPFDSRVIFTQAAPPAYSPTYLKEAHLVRLQNPGNVLWGDYMYFGGHDNGSMVGDTLVHIEADSPAVNPFDLGNYRPQDAPFLGYNYFETPGGNIVAASGDNAWLIPPQGLNDPPILITDFPFTGGPISGVGVTGDLDGQPVDGGVFFGRYNSTESARLLIFLQSATGVPTMNEWGLIIFMVLAGLGAAYFLPGRKNEA